MAERPASGFSGNGVSGLTLHFAEGPFVSDEF
jgi:hypothetical protein